MSQAPADLLVRNVRVVHGDGRVTPRATVVVRGATITHVEPVAQERPAAAEQRDGTTVVRVEALTDGSVAAIAALVPEGGKVILDLRELHWRLEAEAIALADHFVDDGVLGAWRGRRAGSRSYAATAGTVARQPPLVLVGSGTVGAGEILASALQRHGAVLVGQKTGGQAPYMTLARDGDVAVWMPVGQWLRADGQPISGNGIEPDEAVEPAAEGEGDPALERALEILGRELEKAA